jgi:single-strand DNA-binding protein
MSNTIIILGNLTKDPTPKFTPAGMEISNFSIAHNSMRKGVKHTTYIECTAWDKKANFINIYLKKGTRVLVTGSLEQATWDDKTTGAKRSKHFINVSAIESLSKKDEAPAAEEVVQEEEFNPVTADQIPF